MVSKYIIKDNKIYELISENEAARVKVKNGVATVDKKETVDYKPAEDFLYAFFEIRAKFAQLFEAEEIVEDEKVSNSKTKKIDKE